MLVPPLRTGYDSTFLLGLVRLSKGDYSKIAEFAERFGQCPMETINKFVSLLSQLGRLQPSKSAGGGGGPSSLKILQGLSVLLSNLGFVVDSLDFD